MSGEAEITFEGFGKHGESSIRFVVDEGHGGLQVLIALDCHGCWDSVALSPGQRRALIEVLQELA